MDAHLIALKLALDGAGVEVDVSEFESRVLLQKTVYLIQRSGLDLSYRFAWDSRGPYCASLAQDCRTLAEEIAIGDDSWEHYTLASDFQSAPETVRGLLTSKPDESDFNDEDWLELLASIDYRVKAEGLALDAAYASLCEEKAHLMHDFDAALAALRRAGLISKKS